jgi:calcineurin-like phosphoesterase family protein
MIYFVSDTHFFHSNIIRYCKRPFLQEGDLDKDGNWISQFIATQRVTEMNELIIKRWNKRVNSEDTVFHLGDFGLIKSGEAPEAPKNTFEEFRNKLNGHIIFLKGNHDSQNKNKSIINSIIIHHGGHHIFLTHDPNFYRKDMEWNFCGHCHGKWGSFRRRGKSIIVDLSVDCWNFTPVTITEIMQAYSEWRNKGSKNE